MTMDNEAAKRIRSLEDENNEHNKRSQDDITCWVLKQHFGRKAMIVSRDQDLQRGRAGMMFEAAPFENEICESTESNGERWNNLSKNADHIL